MTGSAGPFRQEEYDADFLWLDETAQTMMENQISVIQGDYPSAGDEIAVPQTYLFSYASASAIGSVITLDVDGVATDFTICGILDLPDAENRYTFLISEQALNAMPGAAQTGIQDYIKLAGGEELDQMQAEQLLEPITAELGLSAPVLNTRALLDAYQPSSESALLFPLLFLFGVINLINVMLFNQLARRMEISMMRSVGLTRKQLYRMMVTEGLLYVLISTGIMLIIGVPVSAIVCRELELVMYQQAMDYVFPVRQVLAYVMVLLAVQLFLSLSAIRSLKKKSLVEQLRETG